MFWNCDFLPPRAISIWTGKEKACYEDIITLSMNLFFDTQYILMLEKTEYWEYFPQKLAAGDFKTEFWEFFPQKLAAGDFKTEYWEYFPQEIGSRRLQKEYWEYFPQKLAAGDFKANTGEIIHDILGAANKVTIHEIMMEIIIIVVTSINKRNRE